MGSKVWATGDVLTAPDVNGYLMGQAVIACTAATRPTSTSIVQVGTVIYETDTGRYYLCTSVGPIVWTRHMIWGTAAGRTRCEVQRSAAQSMAAAALTTVTWDAEISDSDAFITTPSTTITIPAGLGGLYTLSAVAYMASAPGANSYLRVTAAGAAFDFDFAGTNANTAAALTLALAAGATITAAVYNGSGAAINMIGYLWLHRIGI